MTSISTVSNTGAGTGFTKKANYQFPGQAMSSPGTPESLSDDFNEAIVPWVGRIQQVGGARIGKSRFAAHDMAIDSSISSRRQRATGKAVKTSAIRFKQAGFFDLGFSLLILALSGSAVYAIEKSQTDSVASTPASVEVSTDRHQQHPVDKVAKSNADTAGIAMR